MDNIKLLFERQEKWQRSRSRLSWTEKLRMAEILRETAISMQSNKRISKAEADNKARGVK